MTKDLKIALAIVEDVVECEAEKLEEDTTGACIAVEIREAFAKLRKAVING